MTTPIDLKALERKAFRATFQDGLWDIMLGLTFLIISLVSLFEMMGLARPFGYLIVFALLIPVWVGFVYLKKHLTLPRLGVVTFNQDRHKRVRQARIALGVVVLVTLVLLVLTKFGVYEGLTAIGVSYLLVGALFVVSFSLLAFYLDYPRLYGYGWLLACEYPLSVWLEGQIGQSFPNGSTVIGALITIIGLVTLIRFLRQYPLPPAEKTDDR